MILVVFTDGYLKIPNTSYAIVLKCGIIGHLEWSVDCTGQRIRQAVQALQSKPTQYSSLALVRRIHLLLTKMVHWSIHHVSRELKKDVVWLAKMTIGYNDGLQFFETPPWRLEFLCI
ncbi:hypothetical protein PVK06_010021 [Gossypium arboreum]|uniref:Uncharacterized protein n=1 Tax=Gossypium arboreum TaxID=29729 RepID=A0ABR0QQ64_GOSAR|nr:hypothetical protein PVK06_010021 [Gossypium arboreum]